MRMHSNDRSIKHLSPDVISVPKDKLHGDPFVILQNGKNNERFNFYRCDGNSVVMIRGLPGQLPADAIQAINKECDTHECSKNKGVKTALRDALSKHFNTHAFHMNEAGAGKFPLINYFPANSPVTFHGIEKDPEHVDTLKTKMGLSASDWKGVPELPQGRVSVGVAVYALQFMVSRDLPAQLKSIISNDGFFVGNMYIDPAEKDHHKQSDFLERTLRASNMGFVRLLDPDCKANEYWIISKTTDTGQIENFRNTLMDALYERSRQRAGSPYDAFKFN